MNIKHIIYTICGVVIILYIIAILSMVEAQEPKVIIGEQPMKEGDCLPWRDAFNILTNAGFDEIVVNNRGVSFYGKPTDVISRSGALWQTFEPYYMTYFDEHDRICIGKLEESFNVKIPGAIPMGIGDE